MVKKSIKEIAVEKDPILFGAFIKEIEEERTTIMLDRLYYIADWVDEYCDLTLDKLVTLAPEYVYSAYGEKDLVMSGSAKEAFLEINEAKERKTEKIKKKGFFERLKGFLGGSND